MMMVYLTVFWCHLPPGCPGRGTIVTLCRAQLVATLGRVTICGLVNHLGT